MSSPIKSLKECEKAFLIKIRKQYKDTMNFQNAAIAGHAMDFKNNQHQNCFDELLGAWEDYRESNGAEEEINDDTKDLPVLPEITKQRTTDDPETVESLILERHIYELLYNLMLATHYQMKQRKDKLLKELHQYIIIKKQKNKRQEIINKYSPKNEKTMKRIINGIYDSIVQKHYRRCRVFTELEKPTIVRFIKDSCVLSFEMLIAYNELSFFPLLFTDR